MTNKYKREIPSACHPLNLRHTFLCKYQFLLDFHRSSSTSLGWPTSASPASFATKPRLTSLKARKWRFSFLPLPPPPPRPSPLPPALDVRSILSYWCWKIGETGRGIAFLEIMHTRFPVLDHTIEVWCLHYVQKSCYILVLFVVTHVLMLLDPLPFLCPLLPLANNLVVHQYL